MSAGTPHMRPGRRPRAGPWVLAALVLLAAGCAAAPTDPPPVSPADPLTRPGGAAPTGPAPSSPAVADPEDATDRLLAAQVEQALAADPSLRDAVIETEVHRGQVTLTGTVPTFQERARAIDAALRVPGVKSVRPQLTLQSP